MMRFIFFKKMKREIVIKEGVRYEKHYNKRNAGYVLCRIDKEFEEYIDLKCVYMITNISSRLRYIGSTKCFRTRLMQHRSVCNRDKSHKWFTDNLSHKDFHAEFEYSILEKFNSITKEDLISKEFQYILELNTLSEYNKNIPKKINYDKERN